MKIEIAPVTKKLPTNPENIKKMEDEIMTELDNMFVVDLTKKHISEKVRVSETINEQVATHLTLGGVLGAFYCALGYDRECQKLIDGQFKKWWRKNNLHKK